MKTGDRVRLKHNHQERYLLADAQAGRPRTWNLLSLDGKTERGARYESVLELIPEDQTPECPILPLTLETIERLARSVSGSVSCFDEIDVYEAVKAALEREAKPERIEKYVVTLHVPRGAVHPSAYEIMEMLTGRDDNGDVVRACLPPEIDVTVDEVPL